MSNFSTVGQFTAEFLIIWQQQSSFIHWTMLWVILRVDLAYSGATTPGKLNYASGRALTKHRHPTGLGPFSLFLIGRLGNNSG